MFRSLSAIWPGSDTPSRQATFGGATTVSKSILGAAPSATDGAGLTEVPTGHGYSRPWLLRIEPREDGSITVSDIRPRPLYLLAVEGR